MLQLCIRNSDYFKTVFLMELNKLMQAVIKAYQSTKDYVKEDSMEKSEDSFELESENLFKADDEKRIAYSIVLKADRPDLEKDIFPAEVVEKTAHEFMEKFQNHNIEHEFDTEDVQPVESFVAPTDMEINGNEINKNDWVMAVKFQDDDLWELAKSGELSGFSVEGTALKAPASEVQ